jgi:ATP adenylyltransferase
MERLWAPWRLAYLEGSKDEEAACVFCTKPEMSDEDALIVHRGEHCYVVLNLYPYTSGHLMVLPYRHVATPGELVGAERADLWELLDRSLQALTTALSAQGHNVGLNLGGAAGAGIADHLHLHVVPRWRGDVNFMPALADVRVMPQLLEETRVALVAAWPV